MWGWPPAGMAYDFHRAALDRAYGNNLSATATSDTILLLMVAALAIILFLAGVNAVSFLTGLWIGATLIQLYFHRFHGPLASEQAPPSPAGPIKLMSGSSRLDGAHLTAAAREREMGEPWRTQCSC